MSKVMFYNTELKRVLNKEQVEQGTQKWLDKRYDMITATNCSSILEANPFLKKYTLLKRKCSPLIVHEDTYNTYWGKKFEKIAFDFYSKMKNKKLHEVGLLTHDQLNWLGASPDGITEDAKLLEIKCVVNRKINKNTVPYYYWIQVQIQLEVSNLEECDFFQCKFEEYESELEMKDDLGTKDFFKGKSIYEGKTFYWKLRKCVCKTIKRDKNWFKNQLPILHQFYKDIHHYREVGLPSDSRKRSNSSSSSSSQNNDGDDDNVSKRTRLSKSRKYIDYNWNEWVSATDTKNYMIDDPVLDWFNLYAMCNNYCPDSNNNASDYNFNEYIMAKGVEFENSILHNLEKRFGPSLVKVANIYQGYSVDKFMETINYMERGIPIISNGILHNDSNKTFGIPDLIIRSDFINKIVELPVLTEDEVKIGCKFNKNWHYRIIDIKFMTLNIGKNDLVKSTRNIPSYKSQVIVYNKALGYIQNYTPKDCYLLGRRIKLNNKEKYGSFYQLGKVTMLNNKFLDKVDKAIVWMKDLKKNGIKWIPSVTKRVELLPNMCNKNDYPWHSAKKQLAHKVKELTLIWNIGISERKFFHKLGIYKMDDIICSSNLITKNKKISKIIDSIVKVNQSDVVEFSPKNHSLKKADLNKKEDVMEFYVDFETANNINDSFDSIVNYKSGNNLKLVNPYDNIIYMIGIGWIEDGTWKFYNLVVNRLSLYEEKKIINKFLNLLKKYPNHRVYHWSNAEPMLMNKALIRNNINQKINWFDLLKVFRKIPINIKGYYSFGLKNIARTMYECGFIQTKWEDSTIDGLDAMLVSWYAENECRENKIDKLVDYKDMNVIVKYNEIDCKVMWDILKYIRLKWKK